MQGDGVAPSAELLTVPFILLQVATNTWRESVNDQSFAAHYEFMRWKRQEELDGKGRVTKSTFKISTNRPASSAIQRMDDEEATALAPRPTNTLHVAAGGRVRGRAVDQRDVTFDGDLLSQFQFTLQGRDELLGRPVLLLDFAPREPAPPPRNLKERFLRHVTGRIWVDEQSWMVAKLDLHLLSPVDFVGGLVGSVKSLRYAFERAVTPEGWWFVRAVDWELTGRAVLASKHVVFHEGRTNLVRLR